MSDTIEISGGPVTKISDTHKCKNCGAINDVEKVFIGKCISETPDLFEKLGEGRKGIESIEEARQIASRLDLSDTMAPTLICDECGQPMIIPVKHHSRKMIVPTQLECVCGQNIDLRFNRDKERVRFTGNWPHVPYLKCRGCRQKLLIPIKGAESWRQIAFRMIQLFSF